MDAAAYQITVQTVSKLQVELHQSALASAGDASLTAAPAAAVPTPIGAK